MKSPFKVQKQPLKPEICHLLYISILQDLAITADLHALAQKRGISIDMLCTMEGLSEINLDFYDGAIVDLDGLNLQNERKMLKEVKRYLDHIPVVLTGARPELAQDIPAFVDAFKAKSSGAGAILDVAQDLCEDWGSGPSRTSKGQLNYETYLGELESVHFWW